jgi:hypothetical protein
MGGPGWIFDENQWHRSGDKEEILESKSQEGSTESKNYCT